MWEVQRGLWGSSSGEAAVGRRSVSTEKLCSNEGASSATGAVQTEALGLLLWVEGWLTGGHRPQLLVCFFDLDMQLLGNSQDTSSPAFFFGGGGRSATLFDNQQLVLMHMDRL